MDLDRGQDLGHDTASTPGYGGTGRALEGLEGLAVERPVATRIDRPPPRALDLPAPDPSDSAQTSFPIGAGCAAPVEGPSVANDVPDVRRLDRDLATLARLFR